MNRKKIFALLLTSAMILSTVLTGCGNSNETPKTSSNNTKVVEKASEKKDVKEAVKIKDKIVYGISTSPSGVFNPIISDTIYDEEVNSFVYSSLLKYDENKNVVCDLAKDYKVSDDNLTITFNLNKNAKWHDGKPLTAKDVEFTFKSIANKNYPGAAYGSVERLKGAADYHEGKSDEISGIKVVNDYTIQFQLNEVYAPVLLKIGGIGIIPEHIWGKVDITKWKENTELLNNPIGSGSYKMAKFEPGQYVELDAFNDYYDGKPKTNKFIFKVTNSETVQAELMNGTVDISYVSFKDVKSLQDNGMKVKSFPDDMIQYMGFNLRDEKLKDKKIRQAFMHGVNRKAIVDKLFEGNGVVINTWMKPTSWGYSSDDELNDYAYSVEKAKKLLKEAGFEDRDGNGIVENDKNEELSFELKYPKDKDKVASIIQANLKEIGVDIKLSSMEFKTLMEQVVGNHEFDLYLMGNPQGMEPDPKPYWYSSAASDEKGIYGWNIVSFKNEEADKLMDQGLSTLDLNERKEIYSKFNKLMNEELPWAFLYCPESKLAYNNNLKDFNPTEAGFVDVEKWYIEE